MTEQETKSIKALAKIYVEGLVNHVKKIQHERKNLRQNTQPDLLSDSVGVVRSIDLDSARTDTMKIIS